MRKIVCLILAVFVLSACESTVTMAPKLSSNKTNVTQSDGIVVARVINTSKFPFALNQMFIAPKELASSKKVKPFLAYAEDEPVGNSSLFAISLPNGEYSISTIRAMYFNGNYYYQRGAYVDPTFGTFKVESGKVTDLGTIVFYPKPQDDQYIDTLVRVPDTADGKLLEKYFPKYAKSADDVLTWDEDGLDDDRFTDYANIAQNPINFTKIVQPNDDSLYFLSSLGVILKYTNDEFEELAVNSDLKLNTLDENDSGDLLVGGYEGALFYKDVNSDEWRDMSLAFDTTVFDVSFVNEKVFDVLSVSGTQLRVDRYDLDNMDLVSNLNTYSFLKKWKNSALVNKAAVNKKPKVKTISNVGVIQSNGIKKLRVIAHNVGKYSVFGRKTIENYDVVDEQWVTQPSSSEGEVDQTTIAGNVELGMKLPGFWALRYIPTYYVRANTTQPWSKITDFIYYCKEGATLNSKATCIKNGKVSERRKKSFTFLSRPWFSDENNGIAIVNFSSVSFWSGERSTETKILSTNNAGKLWVETELELPKPYCNEIITEISDYILLSCDGATTDFYRSDDMGESWEHIRQQQAF